MNYFSFKISQAVLTNNSQEPFDFEISSNQNWIIYGGYEDNVFSIIDWLGGDRYYGTGSVEYNEDGYFCEGRLATKKYYEILRFKLKQTGSDELYYQQRYHATENDDVVRLKDYLGEISDPEHRRLLTEFRLNELLEESVNMLSSGEFRKAYIFRAYMNRPRIVFIEEPYIGIDKNGIKKIDALLEYMASGGTSVVIISTGRHIPGFITHVVHFRIGKSVFSGQKELFRFPESGTTVSFPYDVPEYTDNLFDTAFEIKDLTVKYGERLILKDINWKAARGEKWFLSGRNGAGKSTLLSFIYADNPKVYSSDVWIFDKKRGTGETIWDIKDRIAYYSPELHRYFDKTFTVERSIRSIVFQNPYKKRELSAAESEFSRDLLEYFGLSGYFQSPLSNLSGVHQRLVLLIGSMLKNTAMLIFDEPYQGFDENLIKKINGLIEKFAENRTFIMVTHNSNELPDFNFRKFVLENFSGKEID